MTLCHEKLIPFNIAFHKLLFSKKSRAMSNILVFQWSWHPSCETPNKVPDEGVSLNLHTINLNKSIWNIKSCYAHSIWFWPVKYKSSFINFWMMLQRPPQRPWRGQPQPYWRWYWNCRYENQKQLIKNSETLWQWYEITVFCHSILNIVTIIKSFIGRGSHYSMGKQKVHSYSMVGVHFLLPHTVYDPHTWIISESTRIYQ